MLSDPSAREIISSARQKNVANPDRSARDFERIFEHFFRHHDFSGQHVLDLGPGQYDFARIVRERGGEVHIVDNDPPVLELGRYLGFPVYEEDLEQFEPREKRGSYDGLFCKFAINVFWQSRHKSVLSYVEKLGSLLKVDGWGWIAPWNGMRKPYPNEETKQVLLAAQVEGFERIGWQSCQLTVEEAAYYGISGGVENNVLFLKNLEFPQHLLRSRRVA